MALLNGSGGAQSVSRTIIPVPNGVKAFYATNKGEFVAELTIFCPNASNLPAILSDLSSAIGGSLLQAPAIMAEQFKSAN